MTTTGLGSVSNSAVCFLQMLCEQKDGSLQILLHGHPSLAVPAPAPIAPHSGTRSASLLQVWVTGQTKATCAGFKLECWIFRTFHKSKRRILEYFHCPKKPQIFNLRFSGPMLHNIVSLQTEKGGYRHLGIKRSHEEVCAASVLLKTFPSWTFYQ